jgi:hypothetical protein
MAPTVIFDEYAVLNGVSFGALWCWVESYAPLLEDPATLGENVHIPGVDGRTGYGKDQDELHVTLVVNVDGDHNFTDDSLSSNPAQQLIDNRVHLRDNLGTGNLQTGDGTVVLSWHQPDGSTVVSTDAQVLGLIGWRYLSPSFGQTTLDLIIPAGAFTGAGFDGIEDGAAIDGGIP